METILYKENLTKLKDDLMRIRKKYNSDGIKCKYIIKYKNPISLYSKKGEYCALEHEVKNVFFYGKYKDDCNCMYEKNSEVGSAYYVPNHKKLRGYYLPVNFLESISIVPMQKKDYSRQWLSIAKSMRKNNINIDMAISIEKHLKGEKEYIEGCNEWKKTDKPKIMSFKKIVGLNDFETLEQSAIKSQYGDYKVFHRRISGIKRDKSIELIIYPDGSKRYNSASEYSGCGNGDYYVMFNLTQAFYAESD
jgi:hypothetical protein